MPKGEKYYLINTTLGTIEVDYLRDWRTGEDDAFFKTGNYFHTEAEAESMSKKLRAVLKGADVIEMPSEEEIISASIDHHPCWCKDGDPHQYIDCDICCVPDKRNCFAEGVKWLKSKLK